MAPSKRKQNSWVWGYCVWFISTSRRFFITWISSKGRLRLVATGARSTSFLSSLKRSPVPGICCCRLQIISYVGAQSHLSFRSAKASTSSVREKNFAFMLMKIFVICRMKFRIYVARYWKRVKTENSVCDWLVKKMGAHGSKERLHRSASERFVHTQVIERERFGSFGKRVKKEGKQRRNRRLWWCIR